MNAADALNAELLEALREVMTWAVAGASSGFAKMNGAAKDIARAQAAIAKAEKALADKVAA